MRVAYLVHDLADPAVARRIRMLRDGGASEITLAGFRRTIGPVAEVAGIAATDLGQTRDGRLAHRLLAVGGALLQRRRLRAALAGADIILARQLEMLALARLARRTHAPAAALAYECLDVHRLMTSPGAAGRGLRAAERLLVRGCRLLVTSSPAFVEHHFRPVHQTLPPVHLAENKVLARELPAGIGRQPAGRPSAGPPGLPPWRIGWFGVIRCARSLVLLRDLVTRLPGRVEVIIRGRPALDVLPDFHALVAGTPGLAYGGPYDRATDLARIYDEVHLTWAVDYFEAGGNSDWLLPNRIYEGGVFDTVPIVRAGTETGRWLAARGAGLMLKDPPEVELAGQLAALTPQAYAALRRAAAAVPRQDLIADTPECARLVAALAGARQPSVPELRLLAISGRGGA